MKSKEVFSKDGITIKTGYPTYIDKKKVSPKEFYHEADGEEMSGIDNKLKGKGKAFVEKTKGAMDWFNQSGIADSSKQLYDSIKSKKGGSDSSISPPVSEPAPLPEKSKGVSSTAKIVVGIVAVGLLLFIVSGIHKSQNKAK